MNLTSLKPVAKSLLTIMLTGAALGMGPQEASDLLRQGISEYGAKQFVTAKQTFMKLQQSRDDLNDQQRLLLDEHMLRIDKAIKDQAAMAAKFTKAQASLKAGHLEEAAQLFGEVTKAESVAPVEMLDQANAALAQIRQQQGPSRIAAAEATASAPAAESTSEVKTTTVTERTEIAGAATTQASEPAAPVANVSDLSLPVDAAPAPASGGSLTQEFVLIRTIKEQKARKIFSDQIEKLKTNVQQNRYDLARGDLQYARQVLEANRRYFDPVSGYEELKNSADEYARFIDDAERTFERENALVQQKTIADQVAKKAAERERSMALRKAQLLDQAMQLKREKQFAEARDKLQEILDFDPNDDKVRFMVEALDELLRYDSDQKALASKRISYQEALIDVDYAMIADRKLLSFPKDWKAISAMRETFGSEDIKEDQQTRDVRRKLKNVIPEFKFSNVPLEQVITLLQDITGINISVDWRSLEAANITKETPVSANLKDVQVEVAIELLLKDLSGADIKLAYEVVNGVLRISTQAVLNQNLVVRVFDISDMVTAIPNFEDAPELQLVSTSSGAGGGSPIFGAGNAAPDATTDRADEIVALVKEIILKDSWVETGGTASIRRLGSQLVVTQTPKGQTEVAGLLRQLRESRAVQVNVECRFLQVTNNFLEEIGVDIDVILNQANAGYDRTNLINRFGYAAPIGATDADPLGGVNTLMRRPNSSAGFLPSVPGQFGGPPSALNQPIANIQQPYGLAGLVPQQTAGGYNNWTPIPIVQNSMYLTDPLRAPHLIVPGSWTGGDFPLAPAFQIAGAFMDNLQVDFMIRATQADRRNSLLQAPKLTMYNGQRAWIAVLQEQAYVSDVTPVVAEGVSAFDPTISTVFTGAVLDVQATVSADRRFVTMTLRPGTATIESINSFTFQVGAIAGTNAVTASVQTPELRRTALRTTVTVPDGGTLLIGGQKVVQETELEAGVPVLSKIPVLKRAFDNRTTVKDDTTLLILLKPTIIVMSEEESKIVGSLKE